LPIITTFDSIFVIYQFSKFAFEGLIKWRLTSIVQKAFEKTREKEMSCYASHEASLLLFSIQGRTFTLLREKKTEKTWNGVARSTKEKGMKRVWERRRMWSRKISNADVKTENHQVARGKIQNTPREKSFSSTKLAGTTLQLHHLNSCKFLQLPIGLHFSFPTYTSFKRMWIFYL
jgi:hypothetical protein